MGCPPSSGEEGDGGRVWGAGQVDEVVDGVDALLGGGAEHGHHPTLGFGLAVAPVATADFSGDGAGPHCLLGPPRGGVYRGVGQEGEQDQPVVVEVIDELAALVVGMRGLGEQFDAFGQIVDDPPPFGHLGVSGVKSLAEKVSHLAGCASRPVGQAFDQFLASAGEVPDTGPMCGCLVAAGGSVISAVGGPAVMNDRAREGGVDQATSVAWSKPRP